MSKGHEGGHSVSDRKVSELGLDGKALPAIGIIQMLPGSYK